MRQTLEETYRFVDTALTTERQELELYALV